MSGQRRVLVLFPDEWDLAAAADPRIAARYAFRFAGFDLFRFPGNLRLFTFDALAFVDRLAARYARDGVDAVTSSDEQFGPFTAALLAQRLGLPHPPVQAVVGIQHKLEARRLFDRIAPEANLRHGLLRRDFRAASDVPLPFPFYVKPVKAAFSVLARRVDSFAELGRHAAFGMLERAIIERLVRPFADVMRAHTDFREDPLAMVCEEIARGPQVTVNGYVRRGKAVLLGTVDSVMYPGTDHFQRFQYPSALPPEALARAEALALRVIEGAGFGHGMFNVEMRIDPASGEPRLIEINPRAAGQFYDLFERVDGYSLFEALLELECGGEPAIRRGAGPDKVAASFVLRDFAGSGLARMPSAGEIERLRARHPGTRLMVYAKRGADLAREMKWLGSYRYAVFNVAGAGQDEVLARFAALCRDIDFHPHGGARLGEEPVPAAVLGD